MNKKSNILYTSLMIMLIIISIYVGGKVLVPEDITAIFNTMEIFYDIPEDSIEVIGYGSSRAWRSLDSMEMYKNYGIGMYNYATNWQNLNTSYVFFRDSLETQSPKIVIFEMTNVPKVLEDVDMDAQIYATTIMGETDYKESYLQQCFADNLERYISYELPILVFHSNWKSAIEKFVNDVDYDFYSTMGYYEDDTITSVEPVDPLTFNQLDLEENSLEILDDIVQTCAENNIEIIFYIAPFSGSSYSYDEAMRGYAEENDCAYINFFYYIDELGIDWETDFYDVVHLNDSGAEKVSNYLAEFITNNYDVTDMRTVENNLWESNLAE